ncbi:hypothetical protein [Gloeobacter kilaueensis]|uniref:Uncharacterized protein n=1 Tax=Gloeobacter kilaueensis (strain ATCC BAA-2537 / CCAP 1431/1 / ULC 316 / JS1) TaxID=1183438 RepID=U5QIB2_GLOK1|nr:hypothetical protein [Gloeobacter kilaueensis]AGY57385.1 hypothetical protein GKIL_1139 [Gloeobacter kilaueensis JS1]
MEIANQGQRISLKEAVQVARKCLEELYSDIRIYDILVEEVEISPDMSKWIITLGFTRKLADVSGMTSSASAIFEALKQQIKREYKLFAVDAETGLVESMKIRKVDD